MTSLCDSTEITHVATLRTAKAGINFGVQTLNVEKSQITRTLDSCYVAQISHSCSISCEAVEECIVAYSRPLCRHRADIIWIKTEKRQSNELPDSVLTPRKSPRRSLVILKVFEAPALRPRIIICFVVSLHLCASASGIRLLSDKVVTTCQLPRMLRANAMYNTSPEHHMQQT